MRGTEKPKWSSSNFSALSIYLGRPPTFCSSSVKISNSVTKPSFSFTFVFIFLTLLSNPTSRERRKEGREGEKVRNIKDVFSDYGSVGGRYLGRRSKLTNGRNLSTRFSGFLTTNCSNLNASF